MKIIKEIFETTLVLVWVTTVVFFFLFILTLPWTSYYYEIWKSPCTEVYDGNELIYRGKSNFYTTESRGTGTIFKQYEEKIFLAKQLKEIQSDKITIKTISCETIKGGKR